MQLARPLLFILLALATAAAHAQTRSAANQGTVTTAAPQMPMAQGEVLEIDRSGRRVLLKHGRIQSLGMDPMTMEFLVPDAAVLASLTPGDKVRFEAVFRNGDYVLTRAEVLKPRARRKPASRESERKPG